MDADLTAMMDNIMHDPVDGPVRNSLGLCGINTAMELLEADDPVVDTLVYDDNGKDTNLPPIKKIEIKYLCNFLIDRYIKKLLIDSSAFVRQDFQNFITSPGTDTPFAPTVPSCVVNATQVHADVKPDGCYPTAATDDECTKVHNKAVDHDDRTTANPVKSTQIDSNATTTANVTFDVKNGPTIDTSSYEFPNTTGHSKATTEETELSKELKKIRIHGSTSKEELDQICHYDYDFDNGRHGASTHENADGENCSFDNIDLDDIPILPKKVPPDPYDGDNPISSHEE